MNPIKAFWNRLVVRINVTFMILSIVPIVVVGVLAQTTVRADLEPDVISHLTTTTVLKEAEFNRWNENNQEILISLAQRPRVRNRAETLTLLSGPTDRTFAPLRRNLIEDHFQPSLIRQGTYQTLALIRASDGQILVSTDEILEGRYQESEVFFIQGLLGTYVQSPQYLVEDEKVIMHISTPVKNNNGQVVAVLAGRVDLGELSVILGQHNEVSSSEETYMVNASNMLVSDSRFEHGTALRKRIFSEGVSACLTGNNGSGLYDDYRGVPVVGVYRWISALNLCILTEKDQADAFATINHMGADIQRTILFAVLASLVVGLQVTRSITGPLRKLEEGAEQIGGGRLDHHISVSGGDEIEHLAATFNQMAARLNEADKENLRLIADLRTWNQELSQKSEALERSNKELELFAYVASHDLQEPLRMVASYLQLLERRYKDQLDAEAHEFIDFAVDGATRMKTLINDLLAYSGISTHGKELVPTEVQTAVDRVLRNVEIAVEESQASITQTPLPKLMANEGQLVLLFQNLIANAIKFRGQKRPEIHIAAQKTEDGQYWRFSVQDNGIGLDPQFKERIFVVFQRLHSQSEYAGTGIGLAVSKRIVERHGGCIWVESQPAEGATFYFTLPIMNEIDS